MLVENAVKNCSLTLQVFMLSCCHVFVCYMYTFLVLFRTAFFYVDRTYCTSADCWYVCR